MYRAGRAEIRNSLGQWATLYDVTFEITGCPRLFCRDIGVTVSIFRIF